MRLVDWVRGLPTELLRGLSRIVITPGPGVSAVVGSFAVFDISPRLDLDGAPIQNHPVAVDDVEGMAKLRPPVVQQRADRVPDADVTIESADVAGQIRELEASGLLGRLNVERLGSRKTVISTHAGTQEERNEWLRQLTR